MQYNTSNSPTLSQKMQLKDIVDSFHENKYLEFIQNLIKNNGSKWFTMNVINNKLTIKNFDIIMNAALLSQETFQHCLNDWRNKLHNLNAHCQLLRLDTSSILILLTKFFIKCFKINS